MITIEQASALITNLLRDSKLDLSITQIEEYDFGWLFFYQSTEYLQTKNPLHMLGGNAPYIVNQFTGEVSVTGTAYSTSHYISNYRLTGHPHLSPKAVRFKSTGSTYNVRTAFEAIRTYSTVSAIKAKRALKQSTNEEYCEIPVGNPDDYHALAEALKRCGFEIGNALNLDKNENSAS